MKTFPALSHSTSNCLRLLILVCCTVTAAPAIAGDEIDIRIKSKPGLQQKISARFEHDGKIVVNQAGQESADETLPMKTVAEMVYHQRLTGSAKDPQSIRYFSESSGDFRIAKGRTESGLANKNRMVVARLKSSPGQRIQIASVMDMLNQSELDLIKNPADPLTYPRLLEKDNVSAGDKWKVDKDALADFLLVDRILYTNAQMMLKTATKNQARIYLLGQVDASVDDVGTSLKVSAIFDIDLKRNLVSDVRLSIDENREAGQIAPGFNGKSRVDVRLVADDSCPQLTTASLKKHTRSRRIKQRLQWVSKEGRFALQYDPRWRMIASEHEAAVLRYIDDGDLLAQCNVVQLPARPADNPLTLEAYKREVQKIIKGDKSTKLTDAKALKTTTGLEALRVSFQGVENEVPVQWIYYHVSTEDGRRMTFVFTLEEEVAKVFQPSDQRMINGLSFFAERKSDEGAVATTQQAAKARAANRGAAKSGRRSLSKQR